MLPAQNSIDDSSIANQAATFHQLSGTQASTVSEMKCGYLKKQSQHCKFCSRVVNAKLFQHGELALSYLQYGTKRIYIYEVERISKVNGRVLEFVLNDSEKKLFAANTDKEADEWFRETNDLLQRWTASPDHKKQNGKVLVRLRKCTEIPFQGHCWLQVNQDSIVISEYNNSDIRQWPFPCIRTYGWRKKIFYMETGRRSETGPISVYVETRLAKDIFKKLHETIQKRKKNINKRNR